MWTCMTLTMRIYVDLGLTCRSKKIELRKVWTST
jgi:hypothetical protein